MDKKNVWEQLLEAHDPDALRKMMHQHGHDDASRAALQKKEPKKPMQQPTEFEPSDKSSSGLELKKEMGVGGIGGFQVPLGIRRRKAKVDEFMRRHSDLGEGPVLTFVSSLDDAGADRIGGHLDRNEYDKVADEVRQHAVREIIRNKVREVVRKKPGGGGYVLYAPNKGKKGKSKAVGTFPTRVGARRAELARFPPKDPEKLKRVRKDVERASKDPRKAIDRERKSARKHEALDQEKPLIPGSAASVQTRKIDPRAPTPQAAVTQPGQRAGTVVTSTAPKPKAPGIGGQFPPTVPTSAPITGGSKAPASTPSVASTRQNFQQSQEIAPQSGVAGIRQKFQQQHAAELSQNPVLPPLPPSSQSLSPDKTIPMNVPKADQNKQTVPMKKLPQEAKKESLIREERRKDHMHRTILSKLITRSIKESLFREEKKESDWDQYITRLSKQALAGDSKFQSLQKNISRKEEGILDDAFDSIRRAVGKNARLKNFGVKRDGNVGKVYLAFGAEFDGANVEPIYIHIEGGTPKIEVSDNARVALTKIDPSDAKLFRAELVTVQESILDEMDDLTKAVGNRDKYLSKLESTVDSYVSSLTSLEVSLLKNLLIKKYRKVQ